MAQDRKPRRAVHLPKRTKPSEFPYGKPTRSRPTVIDKLPKWTSKERLAFALANDNRGVWFLARSSFSVAELETMFFEQRVAVILYERIGALLQGPLAYIYVQIDCRQRVIDQRCIEEGEWEWRDIVIDSVPWAVARALTEIHVVPVQPVDIQHVLKSGLY